MRFFQSDSPLMEGLARLTDLVVLNLVVLVCCIPVFTIGAALTGMHYVLLKMARNEEGYIVRSYLRSFKENFLQATGMWLFFLLAGFIVYLDLRLLEGEGMASVRVLLAGGGFFIYLIFLYAFPLLARYRNTVRGTLANAARLAAAAFPRALGMAVLSAAPVILVLAVPFLFPLLLLLGLSGTGYACALLYSPLFARLEEGIKPDQEKEEGEKNL
ncbi:MAG: YesL family protein [Eubacteriales bacterium]|nr:YesL family protein [Eubacteriales bacterium]